MVRGVAAVVNKAAERSGGKRGQAEGTRGTQDRNEKKRRKKEAADGEERHGERK